MKLFIKRHSLLRRILAGPVAIRRACIDWRQQPIDLVLKRMSEIVREDIVFEAEEFGGVFSIDPRSHLLRRILQNGSYEPRVSRLFLASVQPQSDVLDIGANVGFFTVAGARKLTTGRLLAAEPVTQTFSRLQANIARNGVADRVILFKGMVGSTKGHGQINVVPGLEEYSSMNTPLAFAGRNKEIRTETVPIETVDDLVDQYGLRPAVLKVDVEGNEFSVFSGAQRTLSKHRPVVVSEIWWKPATSDGHSGAEIVRMFKNLDYVVLDSENPLATLGSSPDVICFPKERYDPSVLKF